MSCIRQALQKDLKYIKHLTDENIGVDFYTDEFLQEAYLDPDKYLYVYVNEDDIPVAYLYMFVSDYKSARELLRLPDGICELQHLNDDSTVGVYKTTCTCPDYRGRGILGELMDEVEKAFRRRGIELILLEALRVPSGKIPAGSNIDHCGFLRIADIEHPWAHIDSYCPYCGNRFCQCNAVLYIKELE